MSCRLVSAFAPDARLLDAPGCGASGYPTRVPINVYLTGLVGINGLSQRRRLCTPRVVGRLRSALEGGHRASPSSPLWLPAFFSVVLPSGASLCRI